MSRARSKAVKCFYFQPFDWTHLELSWADLVTLSPTMLHLVSHGDKRLDLFKWSHEKCSIAPAFDEILSISISLRLRH